VFDLYSEYGREHMKNLKPIAAWSDMHSRMLSN
jgi:hypothetical protein